MKYIPYNYKRERVSVRTLDEEDITALPQEYCDLIDNYNPEKDISLIAVCDNPDDESSLYRGLLLCKRINNPGLELIIRARGTGIELLAYMGECLWYPSLFNRKLMDIVANMDLRLNYVYSGEVENVICIKMFRNFGFSQLEEFSTKYYRTRDSIVQELERINNDEMNE